MKIIGRNADFSRNNRHLCLKFQFSAFNDKQQTAEHVRSDNRSGQPQHLFFFAPFSRSIVQGHAIVLVGKQGSAIYQTSFLSVGYDSAPRRQITNRFGKASEG